MIFVYDPIPVGERYLVEVQDFRGRLARHWFDDEKAAWAFATEALLAHEDTFRHHRGITVWAAWLRRKFGAAWKTVKQEDIEEELLWAKHDKPPVLHVLEEIEDPPTEKEWELLYKRGEGEDG